MYGSKSIVAFSETHISILACIKRRTIYATMNAYPVGPLAAREGLRWSVGCLYLAAPPSGSPGLVASLVALAVAVSSQERGLRGDLCDGFPLAILRLRGVDIRLGPVSSKLGLVQTRLPTSRRYVRAHRRLSPTRRHCVRARRDRRTSRRFGQPPILYYPA